MDPGRIRPCPPRTRLPRTRGDGPPRSQAGSQGTRASPHTRGWTLRPVQEAEDRPGFPAHAGMDRTPSTTRPTRSRLPRTRGDGPSLSSIGASLRTASPHTRGWTPGTSLPWERGTGFPAHAGMDPSTRWCRSLTPWLPRTRGDGPGKAQIAVEQNAASPHTRGWTLAGPPAEREPRGFPAHAGMDPASKAAIACCARLPRTRGDGPLSPSIVTGRIGASPHTRGWTVIDRLNETVEYGFPAHAGMDLLLVSDGDETGRLPRTRGDGPGRVVGVVRFSVASPHTRGWTHARQSVRPDRSGFPPAHAGMDPCRVASRRRASRLPPHTRGWTPAVDPAPLRLHGFPAHAGMDPTASTPPGSPTRLPRTRGDGPFLGIEAVTIPLASPHTRGWTRCPCKPWLLNSGFPAHAGMDPST